MPKSKPLPINAATIAFESGFLSAHYPEQYKQKFDKFRQLLDYYSDLPDETRMMHYKFFVAVALDAHARDHAHTAQLRHTIFEAKNRLFLAIANSPDRRFVGFRFLRSRRVKILISCATCEAKNQGIEDDFKKTFCPECTVDRHFYDLFEMTHLFPDGYAKLCLSSDRVPQIKRLTRNAVKSKPLEDRTDEVFYNRIPYARRDMRVFSLDSCFKVAESLLLESANAKARAMQKTMERDLPENKQPTFSPSTPKRPSAKGAISSGKRFPNRQRDAKQPL